MSKSTRTDTLVMQAIRGVQKNRQGSAKTRHNHIKEARRFVNTIRGLGYGVKRWKNISNKHVHQAVNKWKDEGLQVATIKEYLSGVRYICKVYGKIRGFVTKSIIILKNLAFRTPQDVVAAALIYFYLISAIFTPSERSRKFLDFRQKSNTVQISEAEPS